MERYDLDGNLLNPEEAGPRQVYVDRWDDKESDGETSLTEFIEPSEKPKRKSVLSGLFKRKKVR